MVPVPPRYRQALLAAEGVDLHFTEAAVQAVADLAERINRWGVGHHMPLACVAPGRRLEHRATVVLSPSFLPMH